MPEHIYLINHTPLHISKSFDRTVLSMPTFIFSQHNHLSSWSIKIYLQGISSFIRLLSQIFKLMYAYSQLPCALFDFVCNHTLSHLVFPLVLSSLQYATWNFINLPSLSLLCWTPLLPSDFYSSLRRTQGPWLLFIRV